MHVISSPVLRGMKSIDQVKLFLTLREALIDSSLVVVIEYSSILLVFLLVWFRCFPSFANTFMHYSSLRSGSFTHLTTKQFVHQESWNEVHLFFVWVCVPVRMPCVQLHKYVFCFLGATNKALKEIQSTYLNNCSPTRACTQTYTNPYITHSDRATLNSMHTHPVLASPLLLHSREQMFGDSLQPQRISVYKANSSTQHFWLQREICSWKKKRGWVFHDDGGEWKKREKGCRQRWNCVKVASVLRRKIPCFLRHLVLWCGAASVQTVSPCGIVQHQYDQPRWPCYISDLCWDSLTSPMQICLLTSLGCPFKSCTQA